MFLTIFDLVLILILFLFIAFGFALGFIQTVGALIGVVLGTWIAGLYYGVVASWISPFVLGNEAFANILAFILVFTIVNRLIGLAFWLFNKAYDIFSIIPFTKMINRLLGALLGVIEGLLAIGIVLYFTSRFVTSEWFIGVLTSSKVALWMVEIGNFLAPLLPDLIKQLQAVI